MFKALGDPTRLRIFEFVRSRCCGIAIGPPPTAGEVCCQVTGLEKVNSTFSFHLKELRQAGLVSVERRGKTMVCGVNENAVADLAEYLQSPQPCC